MLPIAPLKHNLPEQASTNAQQQQQQGSPQEQLAAAAASSFLHGRSPLGVRMRDKLLPSGFGSQQLHCAAAAAEQQLQPQYAVAEPQQQQPKQQLGGGRAFRQRSRQPELEHEQQQADHDSEPGHHPGQDQAHSAGAEADEGQALSSPALERAGSINHRPLPCDEPDTPVNVADTADDTSCSGTPNTPAGTRADATGGAGHLVSPSEYVTPPQHRLRASRPLAPLHKDCLIAAATRSLADGLAQQQQRQQKQQASGSLAARAAAAAIAAGHDSPGQCSGDSSRILSCQRLMDSPLEAAALTHSPSQWHQGMVAMLHSLQQTPLQPKGPAAQAGSSAAAAAAGAPAAAAGSPAEVVGIKVCSRALRRLQDEPERGSAATAAAAAALIARQQQQRQLEQQSTKQEQQQGGPKDSDAEVPFSAGLSMAPTMSGAGPAGASCSTPMMLPLFTTPAAAPGSSRLPARGDPGSSAAHNSTTPLALAPHGNGGLASVSLTPAVVTLHTPAGSGAASAATPRMPAMAWPVQQRSDGGLVVSAPMTGGTAAPAAGTAASGALLQLTPAASCTKAAAAGATPFPPAAGAAAGSAAMQHWPQASPLSVVSIQPLLATACNAAVAAGQVAAMQSVLSLQPAAAAAGQSSIVGTLGVPEQLRAAGVTAGSTAGSVLRDSSHAIRSRLHALIDSV